MLHYQVVYPIVPQGDYVLGHSRQLAQAARQRAAFRRAVIALNKAIAGLLGMDPLNTISSNIALRWSRRTGLPFEVAKRRFHALVAREVSQALVASGMVHAPRAVIGRRIFDWLESFDSSSAW